MPSNIGRQGEGSFRKNALDTHKLFMTFKACRTLCLSLFMLLLCGVASATQVALWPTIPFVRGQDLCQYQDAYGRTRTQQSGDMARLLADLIRAGADPQQAPELLQTLNTLIDQGRQRATGGFGMDVLLEGSFKAALDRMYEQHQPQKRQVVLYNPRPSTSWCGCCEHSNDREASKPVN